jgi:hypothetical protein
MRYEEPLRLCRMRKRGRTVARLPAVMARPVSMLDQMAIYIISIWYSWRCSCLRAHLDGCIYILLEMVKCER